MSNITQLVRRTIKMPTGHTFMKYTLLESTGVFDRKARTTAAVTNENVIPKLFCCNALRTNELGTHLESISG
jgi:hypothetical protein